MLFCTKTFLLFFLLVFVVYWALPWRRPRVYWLLAASLFFYASWSRWLACVVCCSAMLDFFLALAMEAVRSPRLRRALLLLSVLTNLGLLCYFKYANFFLRSVEDALAGAGLSASLPVLKVILPLGISFYTFEAISYTADVYLGRIAAERSLANFLLFILFFPHLVAGPIVRGRDFLPQARRRKRWNWARLYVGAVYVVFGVVKKLAIADRMAQFADPVYADPAAYGSGALWLAALAYALQVYCDFSGYSDIALGCAHLLGYRLTRNFDRPFLAPNIAAFWRRWHMSLSSWLRDYLYIPLGGSRRGAWATYRNLFLVMLLAGLWHGAAWTNIVWGAVQGVMLLVHRLFQSACERRPALERALASAVGTVLRTAFTFFCFCYSLVIFRSLSLSNAWLMMGKMLTGVAGLGSPLPVLGLWLTVGVVVLAHALGQERLRRAMTTRVPAPAQGLALGVLFTVALLLAPDASKAFVYFQF